MPLVCSSNRLERTTNPSHCVRTPSRLNTVQFTVMSWQPHATAARTELVEIQGTGEGGAFKREQLDALLGLAFEALPTLIDVQRRAIDTVLASPLVTVTT